MKVIYMALPTEEHLSEMVAEEHLGHFKSSKATPDHSV